MSSALPQTLEETRAMTRRMFDVYTYRARGFSWQLRLATQIILAEAMSRA
jgi:hypothetical protein